MRPRDLDYLVIVTLLACSLYVASTGLLMDLFGSHQFFLHPYAGYASAILVGLHLILNWGRITAYLRRRFKRLPVQALPAQPKHVPLLGRRGFVVSTLAAGGGFILGSFSLGRWLQPAPRPDEVAANYGKGDLGQFYHQWSKPGHTLLPAALFSWGRQPARYKSYPDAARITLPPPHNYQEMSLQEAIERRRSRREYLAESLSLEELSALLHAASGVTDSTRGFRAAPSAGALYPIETYAVVHDAAGLEAGLYHYAVPDHTLEQLQRENLQAAMMVAGIGQTMLGQAQVCFVLSAIFQRTRWKYRERTYRYVLLEAGHIGQNLYLAATAMGLGACAVGAFLDDNLNDLLGLDGEEEAVLYIIAVGKV